MGTLARARYTLVSLALAGGLVTPAHAASPLPVTAEYLIARDAESTGDWITAAAMFGDVWERSQDRQALREAFLFALGAGDMKSALRLSASITPDMPEIAVSSALQAADAIHREHVALAAKAVAAMLHEGLSVPLSGLLAAWLSAGSRDPAIRAMALPHLDAASDFDALKTLHAALLGEFTGDRKAADKAYAALVKGSAAPRIVALAKDYYTRTHRPDLAAQALARLPATTSRLVLASLRAPAPPSSPAAPLTGGAAEAFHDIAEILLDADHPDVALFYAQISVYLSPSTPDSHFLLGEIMQAEGRYRDAAAELSHAPIGSSFGLLARMDAALDFERAGDRPAAIAAASTLVRDQPLLPEPRITLANMLRSQGRYDQASSMYGQALREMPATDPDRASVLFGRAIAYDRAGKPDPAEDDLKTAIALSPDQPLMLNYLGYFWVTRGEHLDDARNLLERAFELRPSDPAIADSLGWALYKLGDYKDAADKLEMAVEGSPAESTLNAHLGDAYWRVGRRVEARYQWQRALINPDPADAASLYDRLRAGLPQTQAALDGKHAEIEAP